MTLFAGVAVALMVSSGSATAVPITIGSDLTAPPNITNTCVVGPICTASSPQLGGVSTASPVAGVIVRWRVRAGIEVDQTALRVLRPAGGGTFDGVGTGATVTPTANSVSTFATRLPIQSGDFIGIDFQGVISYFNVDSATDTRNRWDPSLTDAEAPRAPTFANQANRGMLVNADIEADANNNGFGDETQECAGRGVTQFGTSGNDVILGTAGNDVIRANGGDDIVRGLGGDDVICGGDGNDKLKGGAGKDRLLGEAGRDKLNGGGAKDVCFGGADKDAIGCEKAKQN